MNESEKFKKRIYPLTQKELSEWLGVSTVWVSNWMTGKKPIKKVYWVATSRENIVQYIKRNKKVKERLMQDANFIPDAMNLAKEVLICQSL